MTMLELFGTNISHRSDTVNIGTVEVKKIEVILGLRPEPHIVLPEKLSEILTYSPAYEDLANRHDALIIGRIPGWLLPLPEAHSRQNG